jgi:hypothetical protein
MIFENTASAIAGVLLIQNIPLGIAKGQILMMFLENMR